jgi:IclR family acetate operon transcriptional repressor
LAVKRSQSASRVLAALDAIALHQPIGVSALAKLLGEDKSAVQRAVMTLADAGWVRAAPEPPTRWELTSHLFAIAQLPNSASNLRRRARKTLETLRDETGESVYLVVPDVRSFVVIEVAESRLLLRSAPHVGMNVPVRESASGRCLLSYFSLERQTAMLGQTPDAAQLAEFAATRERGYSLSVGDVAPGSTTLAAPIMDADGRPLAALALSGPHERLPPDRYAGLGARLAREAHGLSSQPPAA